MTDGSRTAADGGGTAVAPRAADRVLVLESSGLVVSCVVSALAGQGLAVDAVADEGELLAALRRGRALVVLELGLPAMAGFELLRRLRERWGPGEVPVLVATDRALEPSDVEALQELEAQGSVSMFAPADHVLFRLNAALHQEEDGRRCQRVPLSVPVQVLHGRATTFAYAYNVSADGMYVRASEAPPSGSRVEVRFALPGGHAHVCAEAVVRHVRSRQEGALVPPGFGLEFTRMDEADARALASHVEAALIAQPWR